MSRKKTLEEAVDMEPDEFEEWGVKQLGGKPHEKKCRDMGIDGEDTDNNPIQVKQRNSVGRPDLDRFAWAVQRSGKKIGTMIAHSFTRDAEKERTRAQTVHGIDIRLRRTKEFAEEE